MIKLLVPWLRYAAGDVVDLGPEVDRKLLERGKGVLVEPEKPKRISRQNERAVIRPEEIR